MKNYSNKEELVEDLENIKKEQRTINANKKDDINKQAEENCININWHENKSNYFQSTYNITGYEEEKLTRVLKMELLN